MSNNTIPNPNPDRNPSPPDEAAAHQRQRLADGAACLAAAFSYLARGWSGLPLCPPDHAGVGKAHGQNCGSPGKAPVVAWKEFQDRRATEAELRRWWAGNPTLNVGMALGPVSGLVRIDVDGAGGEAKLWELSGGDLPSTLEFASGRENGGRGLLYRIPDGVTLRTTYDSHRKKEELRFQAKGAQTVLPPSRHKDGNRYAWLPGHGPGEMEPATMPAWLVAVMREDAPRRRPNHATPCRNGDGGDRIPEGRRDDTLTSLAGSMRRRGMTTPEIDAALQVTNEQRCDPPLPPEQVAKIAGSIGGRLAGDSRPPAAEMGPAEADAILAQVAQVGRNPEKFFRDEELLRRLARLSLERPNLYQVARGRAADQGISLRGLDASIKRLRQEIAASIPADAIASMYQVKDRRTLYLRPTQAGPVPVPLADFAARIVEQTTHDDGAEQRTVLAVEGELADGRPLPRVDVTAADFGWMRWPAERWGTKAVVYAGAGTADHLRVAIQLLSGDVPTHIVFAHLGWREIGGQWVYLHAAGAIGAAGPAVGVEVQLPEALSGYALPPPPDGADLAEAVRASLRFLDLAPDRITIPVHGAVCRAVLAPADYAPHLAGPTGEAKTELVALCQQHWGAGLDARHLPGNWASTGNSLETLAHAAKDALLVVDDFAPGGSVADVARAHREADRLLRAQGNRAGRARCRTDGTLRPARPPRGTILSTGEDVPRGQSLRARLFTLDLAPGEVDWARLTFCQRDAAAGLYAAALAGYLRWLAPRIAAVRDGLRAETATLREHFQAGGSHARTPDIVADLAAGWRYFLDFAESAGAIDLDEREALDRRVWTALLDAAARQAEHVQAAEPCGCFLRLRSAALASGRAHVAGPGGAGSCVAARPRLFFLTSDR